MRIFKKRKKRILELCIALFSFVMRPAWWPAAAAAAALSHSFCSSSSVEDVVVVMSELKMLGLNAGLEASSTATAGPTVPFHFQYHNG